ncbi:MAG: thioredoxin [Muribaculaceae bacterium]|nr:thioredoxin [Muribaculaceae bacterium]
MDEFNKLIAEDRPTLVDFFATWCGPCKMQAPILETVKNRVGDKANIIKVDVDKNQALAAQYHVQSVPTIILFKNGEAVWRTVGVQQADILEKKIYDHQETKSDERGVNA